MARKDIPPTHCVKGHAYDEANTWYDAMNRRRCIACRPKHPRQKQPCMISGCPNKAAHEGLCVTHWHERGGRPGPKAARKITPDGYVRIGRTMEHRIVMSDLIGRPLKRSETVHHRNGNRADNRPENLELMVHGQHPKGQRVEELVEWAKQILSEYEPVIAVLPHPEG